MLLYYKTASFEYFYNDALEIKLNFCSVHFDSYFPFALASFHFEREWILFTDFGIVQERSFFNKMLENGVLNN